MPLLPASVAPFWMRPLDEDPPSTTLGALGLFLAIALLGALYGSFYLPSPEGDWGWYPRLAKPVWTPEPVRYGWMAAALIMLHAVAGWRLWRTGAFRAVPLTGLAFSMILILLSVWSTLFYGLQSPLLGMVDFILLSLLSMLLGLVSLSIDRVAGWLMAPVVAYSVFGLLWNAAIWRLNS